MGRTIVFNILGTTLDKRFGAKRWEAWRPSVSICQHNELLIDEYHLIYPPGHERLKDLVVDDIVLVSPETVVKSYPISFSDPWDLQEVYGGLLDFIQRFSFVEDDDYLFSITTGTHVAQICIFLLTESRRFPGKLIQSSPTKGVSKSIGSYAIIDLDLSKYDKLASRFEEQVRDDISFLKSGIETRNKKFNDLIENIEIVALKTNDPILLTGPTGAGKSLLASRIFELKKNYSQLRGNFIEVNCATLKGEQALSALFGHVKGAFTGAQNDRKGYLRSADQGIVFLDEIGTLGRDEQALLLKAIEEKKVLPLGSDNELKCDFQLICGTNLDLQKEVIKGQFREDLLARINLWTFELPRLAERIEDIEPNIDFELARYTKEKGRQVRFAKEARKKFLQFATSVEAVWKANFRDLNNAMNRMCTLSQGGRITLDVLDGELERLRKNWSYSEDTPFLERFLSSEELRQVDLFEAMQLEQVLKLCQNMKSLSSAGRVLFQYSRTEKKVSNDADRLRKYLGKFGLSWGEISSV